MKRILIHVFTAILALSGCANFLDVNPKGETFDNDMFTSEEGYEDAIYGIYSEVANTTNLYAGYLHWIPEAMCQNINCNKDYRLGNLQIQNWSIEGTDDIIADVWTDVYKTINHINNILAHIEEGGEDEFEYTRLYKGEMLAMRALLHYEMLHLLCPPLWASEAEKKIGIPYVKKYSFDITPFSTVDLAYELVLEDLLTAEKCLEQDKKLIQPVRNNFSDGFTSCRITHLNLYAVQGLIARVYWSMDQMEKAATYAQKVIDSKLFSFRPNSAFIQSDNGTLDLNETLFGLYSLRVNDQNNKKYAPTSEATPTFNLATDWKSIYEKDASGSMTDLRLSAWFDDYSGTLTKLVNKMYYSSGSATVDINSYQGKSILGVNIICLPEMYFIVAEANLKTNPEKARSYFDKIIQSRGLQPLKEENVLLDQERLFRERRKEFYGDGMTWYDMKKFKMDVHTVVGTTLDGTLSKTYTIRIPEEEFEGRENIK